MFSFSDTDQQYTAQLNNGTHWTGTAGNLNAAHQAASSWATDHRTSIHRIDTTARMGGNR